jgi:hypothetical protein
MNNFPLLAACWLDVCRDLTIDKAPLRYPLHDVWIISYIKKDIILSKGDLQIGKVSSFLRDRPKQQVRNKTLV